MELHDSIVWADLGHKVQAKVKGGAQQPAQQSDEDAQSSPFEKNPEIFFRMMERF